MPREIQADTDGTTSQSVKPSSYHIFFSPGVSRKVRVTPLGTRPRFESELNRISNSQIPRGSACGGISRHEKVEMLGVLANISKVEKFDLDQPSKFESII